ncbi:hypothetical protein PsorP6_007866 [Peronosclerospora sorghi]|uniref:Uncharacterized protein n=1 Tax=Peronosclerospora sorghi TaxID=230839 RepID=A0ACC0W841_9STRA|nr:hypothetical protein PsorP6_007866 [Peronosclerospora sorghi]
MVPRIVNQTKTTAVPTMTVDVRGNKRTWGEEDQVKDAINGTVKDEDEDEVVTLSEVLEHNEYMAETADAVLGDASDTHCSYPMGYMRQAVYACITCTPDALEKPETRAGVCLACTYNCHRDHDLVELYTKRAFRCDCGNQKFPSTPCKLEPNKARVNARNTYSQNYGGRYCNCHRPYPDPERTTREVMVQCVVCEDWLHEEHIFKGTSHHEASQPAEKDTFESPPAKNNESCAGEDQAMERASAFVPETFDELICLECMQKYPFLMAYTVDSRRRSSSTDTDENTKPDITLAPATMTQETTCVLTRKQAQLETEGGTTVRPTFWSSAWRQDLCHCSSCVSLFEKHGIAFLLDPDDSLHVYEASAREKKTLSDEQVAQRALATKLTHEQQVEVARGYCRMKTNLQQYLATFAAEGKTVRKEDIQRFFHGLSQAKRQKTEHDDDVSTSTT